MSKCWYCNNELTSDDSPKHFGICNKCYDKMFKSGDTIIRSLTNKISDLEAKLKALQNGIIDDETLNMLVKEHKLYKDLEAKLAESEKKAYSRGHSQRDIANEIKLNALREDVANKEKRIVELKQQLAEKDKAIENWQTMYESVVQTCHNDKEEIERLNKKLAEKEKENELMAKTLKMTKFVEKEVNQDKISFALEQLEKVRSNILCNEKFYFENLNKYIDEQIDNQINVLRNNKDGIH